MELKNFLKEFEGLTDSRAATAEKIKAHNLPVIIFGAAAMAKRVANELNSFGIEVAGYAVDAEYFKPNQSYLGKPIYNFAELRERSDKYVFVLGVGSRVNDGLRAWNFIKDGNIIRYAIGADHSETIGYHYILEHKDSFWATFNLLNDELSRRTMSAYFKANITLDVKYLEDLYRPNQYFNELTNGVVTRNRGGGTPIVARSTEIR